LQNELCELAATPGIGRVYECGNCAGVHIQVGPVSITLTRAAYLQVVEMLNRSAANFELLMECRCRRGDNCSFKNPSAEK